MSSPAKKKRKLGNATPAKGGKDLMYFFGKKKEEPEDGLTDEEVARRLHEKLNGVGMGVNGERDGVVKTVDKMEGVDGVGSSLKRELKPEDEETETKESTDVLSELEKQLDAEMEGVEPESSTKEDAVDEREEKSVPKGSQTEPSIDGLNLSSSQPTASSSQLGLPSSDINFDVDTFHFNPETYRPLVTTWPNGRVPYSILVQAFTQVNSTRSRLKIISSLTNLIRFLIALDPSSLLSAVWLSTNSIAPPYGNLELGIGPSVLSKAIVKTSGITSQALKALYNKHGDAGDVAFEAKVKQRTLMMRKPTSLTVVNVFDTLKKIAEASGKGSAETKLRLVERMLVDAKGEEVRYLVRTLVQHLRIGAVKTTMLIALSRAFSISKPTDATWEPTVSQSSNAKNTTTIAAFTKAEELVKQCFARCPNYNELVPALLKAGPDGLLEECPMRIHIPLKPMLGSITRDLSDMLAKLPDREFACEYKYDGQRAQIHCDEQGKVSIFSRHLELMTDKYPDLVALIPKIRGDDVTSFIMEGEIVAIDPATGQLKNFQTLAGRGRTQVQLHEVEVDVCMFAFDLMYLNGEELLARSFRERRDLLRSLFIEIPNRFTWVKNIDATSTSEDAISEFFKSALDQKCEGIMVKVLDNTGTILPLETTADTEPPPPSKAKDKDKPKKGTRRKALLSTYEPDKRLESWLKVKKDYDSAADSLDLIPIGGWHGNGRKAAWWSPVLLAVRNEETGTLEAVCKCMSGFTDEMYKSMRAKYDPDSENGNTRTECPSFVDLGGSEVPSVWFEPQEVWELKFGDITLSPTYPAAMGLVNEDRGLSLRFPRFIKVREDKSIEEASDRNFLADLYVRQEGRGEKKAGADKVNGDGEGEEVGELVGGFEDEE